MRKKKKKDEDRKWWILKLPEKIEIEIISAFLFLIYNFLSTLFVWMDSWVFLWSIQITFELLDPELRESQGVCCTLSLVDTRSNVLGLFFCHEIKIGILSIWKQHKIHFYFSWLYKNNFWSKFLLVRQSYIFFIMGIYKGKMWRENHKKKKTSV